MNSKKNIFLKFCILFSIFGIITCLTSNDIPSALLYVVILFFLIKKLINPKTSSSNTNKNWNELNYSMHAPQYYRKGLTDGERYVADLLSDELDYHDYFIFNNLILPSSYMGSSQIDHIVVSPFGIFVIESKDYDGWIFGKPHWKNWTQSFPNGKKYKFNNPIRQNSSHIKALIELFPTIQVNFFLPLVVFTGKAEIKTAPIPGVHYVSRLIPEITKYNLKVIQKDILIKIIGELLSISQTADITLDMHLDNITNRPH